MSRALETGRPRLHHKDHSDRDQGHIILPSGNVFVPPVAGSTPGGRMLRDSLAGLVNPAAAAEAARAAEAAAKAEKTKASAGNKPKPLSLEQSIDRRNAQVSTAGSLKITTH